MSSRKPAAKPLPKFETGETRYLEVVLLIYRYAYLLHTGDDYEILHSIGEGAYGTVVSATHRPTGRQVAIKRVLPFEHTLFCLRTLRELKLLKFFSEQCVNENVRITNCQDIKGADWVWLFRLSPSLISSNRLRWMTSRRSISSRS